MALLAALLDDPSFINTQHHSVERWKDLFPLNCTYRPTRFKNLQLQEVSFHSTGQPCKYIGLQLFLRTYPEDYDMMQAFIEP